MITSAGRVEAGAVVIALGAWVARLREVRRAVLPVASHIVATEPIPERIEQLGWTGGELLGDPRTLVHYSQVSPDGRIVFGRGGGVFGSAGRVVGRHFADPAAVREVEAGLRRWFPMLSDVRITHAWGGPVDHAPGHLPWVAELGDSGTVHYAAGFSGNGVAPSAFVGQILGRRALGIDDELTRCALVGDPPGLLPPEPLRTAGGFVVRDAVRRAEAREEQGERARCAHRPAAAAGVVHGPGRARPARAALEVRLAIIADTHLPRGRRALPAACEERLREADAILHAGDFVEAPVLRGLEALGPPVHAVFGNQDDPVLRHVLPRGADGRPRRRPDRDAPRRRAGGGAPRADAPPLPRRRRGRLRALAHPAARDATAASRSSTPARRPTSAASRRPRWAWRRWTTAGSPSSSSSWAERRG